MEEFTTLYHLSYDPISQFSLRVPAYRGPGEDDTVKRICLAPSIEDCIIAKPGRSAIAQIALEREIPLILYVYEAKLPKTDPSLVYPDNVFSEYGVQNAIDNQEYWLTRVPEFEELLLLLDHAEFESNGSPYPTIKNVIVHSIDNLPEFCVQHLAKRGRKHLGKYFDTDIFTFRIPKCEARYKGDIEEIREMIKEMCHSSKKEDRE